MTDTLVRSSRAEEIPPERIWDIDIRDASGIDDPLKLFAAVRAAGAPDIFYSTHHGGHWVFCDFDSVQQGYHDWELFSSYPAVIPPVEGLWRSLPQGIDPPDHAKYRLPLNRAFSTAAIQKIEDSVRQYAVELIDELAPRGECEFVNEFAFRFPPAVFMKMMGMDLSRLEEFVGWTHRFFRGGQEDATEVMQLILGYMSQFIVEKEARPTDDLGSAIANLHDEDGAPFSFDERLNMCALLFMAGLDTVANSLASIWRQLAEDPDVRNRVVATLDDPKNTLDELFRFHAIAALSRRVTRDAEFRGVQLKEGDIVLLSNVQANHDPNAFPDPETIDLERNARKHLTFGYGPHRCVGQFLAKMELTIALQEWFKRIPAFELAARPVPVTGQISGYISVHLKWPVG